MADPIIIGTETKFIKDANSKQLTLYCPVAEPASTYSLHNCEDNANYSVPADKKFVITSISMDNVRDSVLPTLQLYWGPNSDSTVGATQFFYKYGAVPEGTANATGNLTQWYHTSIEIATGNYINFKFDSGYCSCVVNGVELDA